MSKPFVIRMILWCVLMLYLALDLWVLSGPLKRELRRAFPTGADRAEQAISAGVCARVHGSPIYLSQVTRRVEENLWRAGRGIKDISQAELKVLRWVALNELIDEAIMRIKIRVDREDYSVSEAAVDRAVERFEKRFSSPTELDEAIAAQGIESRKELRYRLAARLQQEQYVHATIARAIRVEDKEVEAWYSENKEDLMMPERRKVRHIFLATLERYSDAARAELQEHLKSIAAGKVSFENVAKKVSEDFRSNSTGGDLGWMSRDRLPEDFGDAVFKIPLNKPALIRTKLGWHIVEAIASEAAIAPLYDDVKKEIRDALSESRKAEAVEDCRRQLRYLEREHIEIFEVVLDAED